MSQDIFTLVEHRDGQVTEGSFELIGKAKALAAAAGGKAVAVVLGDDLGAITAQLGGADAVIQVAGASVADFTPTAYVAAVSALLREREPALMLFTGSAEGMDSSAGLSATLGLPLAGYATDVSREGDAAVVTSQVYGGKLMAEAVLEGATALVSAIAGAFPADAGRGDGSPAVETVDAPAADVRVTFRRLIHPEAADVDITKEDILVAVGRGIGDADEIEIVEELAEALGGAVACSRPVVDAGWLPKARQVGKSGHKVKPKLYVAVGISGAPEHLEGMRDAELIVAINSDAKAPIFGVAHYGISEDLFDVVPALTELVAG
ncbi:MAG: electron transfer flavoprotein subunit alpha/FixB family protein [Gemmatimonadetes bacterium]|nr:electron transfer flavoprotein subunit alpha/FixB family protein [Gemmatimonadota bacterium]